MNLYRLLGRRAESEGPVRIGLIGAGKFGTMFLAQARVTPGLHVQAVADLRPDRARAAMLDAGWADEQLGAAGFDDARASGRTLITEDVAGLIAAPGLEVVVEATGDPRPGPHKAGRAAAPEGPGKPAQARKRALVESETPH